MLQRGLHAEAAAEYQSALRSLDQAAARDEARYGLAMARYHMGEDAQALRVLDGLETGSRFPFRADADVLRVHLLFRQKDYARAAEAAQAAIAHRDHAAWPQTASLLVESLHRAGRHEQAAEAYTTNATRLEKDPGSYRRASLLAGLSQASIAKREADHAKAAEWFARAIPARGRDDLGDIAMLQRAESLRRAGRTGDALDAYRLTLSRGGEAVQPDAMLSMATMLRADGKTAEAIQALKTLADQHPRFQSPRVQFELGLAHLENDEPAEAARALDRAARTDDDSLADDIAYWRAKADLRRDRPADAAKQLSEAVGRYPQSELIAEMRYDRAVALERAGDTDAPGAFQEFLSAHGEHRLAPDALYAQASLALKAGDTKRASGLAQRFQSRYADHPLTPNVKFLMGEAAYRQGEYGDAASAFATLIETDDASLAEQSRYRLGMSLHAIGRNDDAAKHLRAVTSGSRTKAEFLPALFTLADIAFSAEQWHDAERGFAHYLEATERKGEAADAATMKLALAQLRQSKTQDGIATLTTLLDTWPRSEHAPHALFELGQAHASAGRDDEAARALNRLIERHESSRFTPHALRHLAAIASRQGDADRAASLYARAADAGGADLAKDIAVDRARALINAGKPEDAARLLQGMEGPARGWRVIALSRAGQNEQAAKLANGFDAASLPEQDRDLYQYSLATSLRATGQTDQAVPILASLAREGSPISTAAAIDLADVHIEAKRYAQAASLLEPIAKDNATAAYKAAWARYQLNDHRAVIGLLNDHDFGSLAGPAAMLAGESLLALKRGREAAAQFATVIDRGGQGADPDAALLRLGEAHAAAQDWRQSQRAYERHRSEHAKSPRWYMAEFGIGWALENGGKPREAMPHYQAVADKHKGDTAARSQFQLGECLFALGEHEQAVRELLRVDILHASPTWSAAALYEAGRCYEAMGKVGEARAQYRAVQDRFAESDWAKAAGERLAAIAGPGGTRTSGRGG
ncbi:MAG: tetratricopeptide repeat protein [Phycisphaerales bacterium JB064]